MRRGAWEALVKEATAAQETKTFSDSMSEQTATRIISQELQYQSSIMSDTVVNWIYRKPTASGGSTVPA